MSTFQNTIPVRHRLGTRGRAMLAAIVLVAITQR